MNIEQYYQSIFDHAQATMHKSLQEQEQLAKFHSVAEDILTWYEILRLREESGIIKNIASELQFSTFSLTCGLYRQSFISLRIVLESLLASIFFSSYKLEFKEWEQGNRDIHWSELINDKSGVLSERWAKAFFPNLEDYLIEEYHSLATKTYRKLSEYVHGNAYTWELNEEKISFSKKAFENYVRQFNNVSNIVFFTLCMRFITTLDPDSINLIREQLIEHFSDIQSIRKIIGLAIQE